MTAPDEDLFYQSDIEWRMWHEDREIASRPKLPPSGRPPTRRVAEDGLLDCGHAVGKFYEHLPVGSPVWCVVCKRVGGRDGPREAV